MKLSFYLQSIFQLEFILSSPFIYLFSTRVYQISCINFLIFNIISLHFSFKVPHSISFWKSLKGFYAILLYQFSYTWQWKENQFNAMGPKASSKLCIYFKKFRWMEFHIYLMVLSQCCEKKLKNWIKHHLKKKKI